MKLRNKKTGEIGNLVLNINPNRESYSVLSTEDGDTICGNLVVADYDTLTELNAEWQDYEEPKDFWYIDDFMIVCGTEGEFTTPDLASFTKKDIEKLKEIGNYFESKEEAEKAVEKLKAWKRLKEFGFRFIDWELDMKAVADGKIWFDVGVNTEWDAERLLELKPEVKESLDILFGGEE